MGIGTASTGVLVALLALGAGACSSGSVGDGSESTASAGAGKGPGGAGATSTGVGGTSAGVGGAGGASTGGAGGAPTTSSSSTSSSSTTSTSSSSTPTSTSSTTSTSTTGAGGAAPGILELRVGPGQPFASLAEVSDHLITTSPVEPTIHVVFPKGSFQRVASTSWKYPPGDKTIRFLPEGYTGYAEATPTAMAAACPPPAERPVQTGWHEEKSLATGQLANFNAKGYWFYYALPITQAMPLRFEFYCLDVAGFVSGAIAVAPKPPTTDPSLANEPLEHTGFRAVGNTFESLGNQWANDPADCAYGGVTLYHAREPLVANNTFTDLVSVPSNAGCNSGSIHAVYLKYQSRLGTITGNMAENVSGDPFRVSFRSDGNTIAYNKVVGCGDHAISSDYRQPGDSLDWGSVNNEVAWNDFGKLYGGAASAEVYCFQDNGSCPPRQGLPRYLVHDNY